MRYKSAGLFSLFSVSSLAVMASRTPTQIMTAPDGIKNLYRFSNPQVCGYVSGNYNFPMTCGDTGTCRYDSDFEVIGCCLTNKVNCNIYTDCRNYWDPDCNTNQESGTACCYNSRAPYCMTVTYSDITASILRCISTRPTARVTAVAQLDGDGATEVVTDTEISEVREATYAADPEPTETYASSPKVTEEKPAEEKPAVESKKGGLSTSDKIALGVGIGFGVPTTIAAVWGCLRQMGR